MATSFGAIMASAAEQSRIAREKDEANQLSMMQAGFIPKEQPAQPEPSGLQSMLASVRDQYAYQPEYAPTDYVPGPAHASSMQAAEHAWRARNDDLTRQKMAGDITQTGVMTEGLRWELDQKEALADLNKQFLQGQVDEQAQQHALGDQALKRGEQDIEKGEVDLQYYADNLANEMYIATLEGVNLENQLISQAALAPLNELLKMRQIEAAELSIAKDGTQFVTAPDGSMQVVTYDPNGSIKLTNLFPAPPGAQKDEIRRLFAMTSEMYRNSDDPDMKEYYGGKLSSLYSQIEIANTLDLLNKKEGSERTFEGGVEVGGGEEEVVDNSELEQELDQAFEDYVNQQNKVIDPTVEEKAKQKLYDNIPPYANEKDWKWYVQNYHPGGLLRKQGGRGLIAGAGKQKRTSEDEMKTKKNRERYNDLNNLYESSVKRILIPEVEE